MKQQILARVAALALLAGSTSLGAESLKLSDLPNNVQKTVNAQSGNGKVGTIEKTTENGRTVYHVEVKREGQNKHLYLSESGTVIRSSNSAVASADTHVETGRDKKGALSKTDGKILGIIPAPSRDNKDAELKVEAGDNEAEIEVERQVRTPADKEADRLKVRNEAGVNIERERDLTSKTDGKILGIPIPGRKADDGANASVKVDTDRNDASASVDVDVDRDRDLTAKNDGRILGVPKPDGSARADVDIATDNDKSVEADVDVDRNRSLTSKNDGRILGIPIPDGKKNTASVDADADLDKGASARVDVDTDSDIIRKNDGKILGVPKPDGSARADVDVDTDDESARVDVDTDTDNDIIRKNDGKILGIRKPDGSARADVDVDTDDKSARVDVDTDTDNDIIRKNDGKILGIPKPDGSARADVDVDTDDKSARVDVDADNDTSVFKKGDGKILGIPKPDGQRDTARVDADVDVDNDARGSSASVDVDVDRDRDLTSKNDGRILGVPKPEANTRVEADTNIDLEDGKAEVEVKKKRSIFGKGDGKILGLFPAPSARKNKDMGASASVESNKDRVQAEVKDQPQNRVTTDADGSLDTDKEDGRILGVPKRGFENLTINQVPAPVRRAIQREAGSGKIVEIELDNDNGQSVYEVDIERDGANREIKITPDGTVLSPDNK